MPDIPISPPTGSSGTAEGTAGGSSSAGPARFGPYPRAVRPVRSCTECTRKKRKCNRETPCSQCIKQKIEHLCRVESHRSYKDSPSLPLTPQREVLRFQTLAELHSMRDDYASRISRLELMIEKAFGMDGGDVTAGPPPLGGGDIVPAECVPRHIPATEERGSQEHALSDSKITSIYDGLIDLEMMALGRTSSLDSVHPATMEAGLALTELLGAPAAPSPSSTPTGPLTEFPTVASLAAAIPNREQAAYLISHAIGAAHWVIFLFHAPTVADEVASFLNRGSAVETTSPEWLAFFFALLVAGAVTLSTEQQNLLGYRPGDLMSLRKQWYTASLAALYQANFVESRSIYVLQAIAVHAFVRDAWNQEQVIRLVQLALGLCRDLGLYRMDSDEAWEVSMRSVNLETRIRSLVIRETQKRVFWGLVREDWIAYFWRKGHGNRPACLTTFEISTPVPLNAFDKDLSAGISVNRPDSDWTPASWFLLELKTTRPIQLASQEVTRTDSPRFAILTQLLADLTKLDNSLAPWWRDGSSTTAVPENFLWARQSYSVTRCHRVLTLHRIFTARSKNFTDQEKELSRAERLSAARRILLTVPGLVACPIWFVPFQVCVGALVSIQIMFGMDKETAAKQEERRLVADALDFLGTLKDRSEIASRGIDVISNLLLHEARLRSLAPSAAEPPSPSRPQVSLPAEWESFSPAFFPDLGTDELFQLDFDLGMFQSQVFQTRLDAPDWSP